MEKTVLPERQETVRKAMVILLEEGPLSAKEISQVGEPTRRVGRASEKDVYAHLEHIRRTFDKGDKKFKMIPPQCKLCGFIFKKRERLKKPSRCPLCKGSSVEEPIFSIE